MKITKKYPDFYMRYKDKKVSSYGIEGVIVGCLINSSKIMQLILEVDAENDNTNIFDFAKEYNITILEYHGDPEKNFYFIPEAYFDGKDGKTFVIWK